MSSDKEIAIREFALTQANLISKGYDNPYAITKLASVFESYLCDGFEINLDNKPAGFEVLGSFCFTNGRVINHKGENYYKACDAIVAKLDDLEGGMSHCVKRLDHPSTEHEDYQGRVKVYT